MYDLTFSILILAAFGLPVFMFWGYPAYQAYVERKMDETRIKTEMRYDPSFAKLIENGHDAADLGKEAFKKFWNGLAPQQRSMIGHHQLLFWIRVATFLDIKGPQNWWPRMTSDLSAEDRERMTATRWKCGKD